MKILMPDQTRYIYPVAHHHNSPAIYTGPGEFIYHHTNMMDACPANQCTFINGGDRNLVEVRSAGGNAIGIAGSNATIIEPHIFNGTVHDETDLIVNGDFSSWSSGYGAAPDGWVKETNCSLSVSAADAEIGGHLYHHRVTVNTPTTTTSRQLKQTVTLVSSKTYKLTVLYSKAHVKHCRFSIYNTTYAFSIADMRFPEPTADTKTSTEGFFHYVFDVALGGQCTIGFYAEGITGSGDTMDLIGVSLKVRAEHFSPYYDPSASTLGGEKFSHYFLTYSGIASNHSVVLYVQNTGGFPARIGAVHTGTLFELDDPYLGWSDGLLSGAVVTELKFGGRLIDKKYNFSVLKLAVNCSAEKAEELMFDVYPALRNTPTFFQIDEATGLSWTVYARFVDPPVMVEKKGARRTITLTIEEAL